MTTLFISDLHLDPSRPDVTLAFHRFMQQLAPTSDALYILGDFFEVWIGDDDDSEFNHAIMETLKAFTEAGGKLYFMVGNRDFLIGAGFAKITGATLLEDPTVIDLYGIPTLLMHGDSLCTLDTEYMAFRTQARSADWQAQLLAQPIEARREIARQLREKSQSMNSLKADDIMDVTGDEVVSVMQHLNVERLIHGHTHRPERHAVATTTDTNGKALERIVLGDWHHQLWWLSAETDGSLTLESRPIASQSLA
jgi:UDP-2,3-diacylglucosamine hydrolase